MARVEQEDVLVYDFLHIKRAFIPEKLNSETCFFFFRFKGDDMHGRARARVAHSGLAYEFTVRPRSESRQVLSSKKKKLGML